MKKTILIITDNTPSQINGVVTTFKNIEHYAEQDGYHIVYLNPLKFYHWSTPGYPDVKLSLPFRIGKKILDINPDYIHIATEGPLGLIARVWLNFKKWKYNTSYHTKFPEFLNELYGFPTWLTYAYLKWFHKHSGQVLTTTQTMVNDLTSRGFNGKIIPWTRGVDRSIFKENLRSTPDRVNSKILLSVGRISKEKGLDDFCELSIPNTIKIVVGDGPYLQELKDRYSDVNFVGSHSGKELATYFACSDVFVFTSKVDTFGIVIIESLSVGTPVAAYPVQGPLDILEQNVNGYMSNSLEEAIEQCLQLDRKQVAKSSLKWSWENCWNIFKNNLIEK